jgi:hypothetical protein
MVLIEALFLNIIFGSHKIFRELSLRYKQLKWDIDWIYNNKLCSCYKINIKLIILKCKIN